MALWKLVDRNGLSSAPRRAGAYIPPWLAMAAHLLVTGGTVALATGLGMVTLHPEAATHTAERWFLFGGLAAYLLATVLTGPVGGASRIWLLGFGVPGLVAALALGVFGEPLAGYGSSLCVLAILGWQVLHPRIERPAIPSV